MEFVSAITSSNPLDRRMANVRERGSRALVCYATAGFPDRSTSRDVFVALEDGGADVIEVGVPFSDPMADGPVIQASSRTALEAGTTLDLTLDMIAGAQLSVPVVLFSYLNPVIASGPDVLRRMVQAGCSGILITDLPVGSDTEREEWLSSSDLAFVRLVAPTTPTDRMAYIARSGSGFVYLISRLGVTGFRSDVPAELPATIARLRRATDLPVCVGFGIATPEQARAVGRLADGVVVGTAIVRASAEGAAAVAALTRTLRDSLDRIGA